MNSIDLNITDDAMNNVNIFNYTLNNLKYLLTLKYYMENLLNESRKLNNAFNDPSLSCMNIADIHIIGECDYLEELLIDPIKIISSIIAKEKEIVLKYKDILSNTVK